MRPEQHRLCRLQLILLDPMTTLATVSAQTHAEFKQRLHEHATHHGLYVGHGLITDNDNLSKLRLLWNDRFGARSRQITDAFVAQDPSAADLVVCQSRIVRLFRDINASDAHVASVAASVRVVLRSRLLGVTAEAIDYFHPAFYVNSMGVVTETRRLTRPRGSILGSKWFQGALVRHQRLFRVVEEHDALHLAYHRMRTFFGWYLKRYRRGSALSPYTPPAQMHAAYNLRDFDRHMSTLLQFQINES